MVSVYLKHLGPHGIHSLSGIYNQSWQATRLNVHPFPLDKDYFDSTFVEEYYWLVFFLNSLEVLEMACSEIKYLTFSCYTLCKTTMT